MGKVIASASVSLDGFIASDAHDPGPLFDWYENGDVEFPNAGELGPFHLTRPSADYWRGWVESLGALLVGRTLFDVTDGWKGMHPFDVPIVVLTHEPPVDWSYPGSDRFHFATQGIEAAVQTAREIAGDKVVGVAAGTVAAQALAAGLLDAVNLDLVPVVLGSGRRYFGDDPLEVALLGDPESIVVGRRVTHLSFPVLRE